MVASSHPSHREREAEREATSRSKAGRSRHASGRTSTTVVMAAAWHQRSAGMVLTLPPAVGVRVTLVVARQLLNNPPSPNASPSAAEQWRHEVDQLVVATINMAHHGGGRQQPSAAHSRTPTAAHALSATRAPSATRALLATRTPSQPRIPARITMTDLRVQINYHHDGEDSCITIELQHKRSQNIEGHNLKKDFGSLAPARGSLAARATHPLVPQESQGGGVHGTRPTPSNGGLAA
jgi:hypothetical protein